MASRGEHGEQTLSRVRQEGQPHIRAHPSPAAPRVSWQLLEITLKVKLCNTQSKLECLRIISPESIHFMGVEKIKKQRGLRQMPSLATRCPSLCFGQIQGCTLLASTLGLAIGQLTSKWYFPPHPSWRPRQAPHREPTAGVLGTGGTLRSSSPEDTGAPEGPARCASVASTALCIIDCNPCSETWK